MRGSASSARFSGIDGRWRQRIPTAEHEYDYDFVYEAEYEAVLNTEHWMLSH